MVVCNRLHLFSLRRHHEIVVSMGRQVTLKPMIFVHVYNRWQQRVLLNDFFQANDPMVVQDQVELARIRQT